VFYSPFVKRSPEFLLQSCQKSLDPINYEAIVFFQEHILPKPRPYYRVDQSTEPDLWLDAVQVWEVKCADLSLSPIYKAGMGLVSITLVCPLAHQY
jgi:hypothetical protein